MRPRRFESFTSALVGLRSLALLVAIFLIIAMSVMLARSRIYDYIGGLPGPVLAFMMNVMDLAALLDKKRNVMRINSCCTVFVDIVVFGLMIVAIVVAQVNAFSDDRESSTDEEKRQVAMSIFAMAIVLTALQLVMLSIGFADCFDDLRRKNQASEESWMMRRQQQFQRRTMPRYA
ncbi:hypothetical protein KVT40_003296 [Elsinoe batatas]|uniref:Uncharacterized protein n=1 Tax=Elsinoe batatas TaxID=2601811 RepID=A0A8K0PGX5_9PEZI|nr:hypothetical protein KVT40_003296 [Elsinoe batatas]